MPQRTARNVSITALIGSGLAPAATALPIGRQQF